MKRFIFLLPMILLAAMTGCDNSGDSSAIALEEASADPSVVAVPTDSDQFLKFLNNPNDDDPSFAPLNENDVTAEAYYAAIDPGNRRLTLSDWLAVNGFGAFNPDNPPADEIHASAVYFNRADLGFGRRMSLKADSDGNVAACVENFRSLEDAVNQRELLVTVCMEYGPADPTQDNPNPDPNRKFTKFYVFAGVNDLDGKQEGERKLGVDLDGRGFKRLPGQCNICHGGRPKPLNADGSYPDGGDTGAFFLPWDLETFVFATTDPSLSRASQEDAFRKFNQGARITYQAVAEPGHELAAQKLVEGWYGTDLNGSLLNQTFESPGRFVPEGWDVGVDETNLYLKVIAPSCRACHSQRGSQKGGDDTNAIDFATFEKFKVYLAETERLVYDQGLMPLARKTFEDFWADRSPDGQSVILAEVLERELGKEIVEDDGTTRRPGRPPIADAGTDRIVHANTEVRLNGRASLFAQEFNWTLVETTPAGLTATLDRDFSVRPTFTPDAPGTYVIELVINQGLRDRAGNDISDADRVEVIVSETAKKPVEFVPTIANIFDNCTRCHSVSEPDGGLAFPEPVGALALDDEASATHEAVIQRINFADPLDSLILTKPAGLDHDDLSGPEQGFNLNDPAARSDHDLVLRWILEGAEAETAVQNNAPEIISDPVEIAEQGAVYTYDVMATDPDGDPLTFSLAVPDVLDNDDLDPINRMTINPQTGEINWTPINAQVGGHTVTVQVEDTGLLIATQEFNIDVANINDPPVIEFIPDQMAAADFPYTLSIIADDLDLDLDVGDTLTFSLTVPPELEVEPNDMKINPGTGIINWIPAFAQVSTSPHELTVRVKDTGDLTAEQTFKITVVDNNNPPMIVCIPNPASIPCIPNQTVRANDLFVLDVKATDSDAGDTLEFFLENEPKNPEMTIGPIDPDPDPTTGRIVWEPLSTEVGSYNVTVGVRDSRGVAVREPLVITVNPSVFFKDKVIPILNNPDPQISDCTSCHKDGGLPPNFTNIPDFSIADVNRLYDEIIKRDESDEVGFDLVDTSDPEKSSILTKPAEDNVRHEIGRKIEDGFNLDQGGNRSDYDTILEWIQEGAQNNEDPNN